MRINPINNNQTNFKSSFKADKNLSLAFKEAISKNSADFLKSIKTFQNDGKDRVIRLCISEGPADPAYCWHKRMRKLKGFLWVDQPKVAKALDIDKCITSNIYYSDTECAKDFAKSRIGCAVFERYFGKIKDDQIDKMTKEQIREAIKIEEQRIFSNDIRNKK